MGIQAFFSMPKTASKNNKYKGGCFKCGLHAFCKHPKMEAVGDGKLGILVLTEYPTIEEDRLGDLLSNVSGQRLKKEMARVGISLWRDCRILPAVQCRPGRVVKGKKVSQATDDDIAFCRSRVMQEIKKFKPKVILCLGPAGIKSICQHRGFETGFPSINSWQGELIPDQELGAHILVTWSVAFVSTQNQNSVYLMKFRESLDKLKIALKKERPVIEKLEDQVEIVINTKQAAQRLEKIYKQLKQEEKPTIAFDYETTGIKPYVKGHKIVSTAICYAEDKAISFFMDEYTWPWLEKFLRNKDIRKAAHNMKFEHIWTAIKGISSKTKKGFPVRGWWWDSMLGAFILDNRTGRTGLKFLTYAKLGIVGYDSSINAYIKNGGRDTNAFNNITNAPARDLLLYNGVDTLATRKIALLQEKAIRRDAGLKSAYKLWHHGCLALTDAEMKGIRIDHTYCQSEMQRLTDEIAFLNKRMLEYPEVKAWKKKFGAAFKLTSSDQLRWLLYDLLKMEKTKVTDTGLGSTDKSIMEDIDLPFAQDRLRSGELTKIRDTYLKSFLRESPTGILHPSFNLNTVVSYRSSSSSPNFQNIPKRDPVAQKSTRQALYPYEGFLWLEIDYSSVEVRIAATYHQDPNMLQYLRDPYSDMHRDMAMQIMALDELNVSKYLRNGAKNAVVFPFFYGDYFKQCAENLWNKWFKSEAALTAENVHIYKHLKKELGIKNLSHFTSHMKKVEDHFWGERFPKYAEWRKLNWQEYQKIGYLRSHTGFLYKGEIMDEKQTSNYPTQGSGFHCLLRSFILINKCFKKEKWLSFLNGQIHDSVDGNVHPSEINKAIPLMRKIMVDDLTKAYSWINVPMDVEFEIAPLNKSWYDLKQIFKRDKACKCGLEWGYSKKTDSGKIIWDCPVCGTFKVN